MQRQRQPQTHSPRRETINMLRGVAAGTGAVSDTAQVACCRLQQHHVYSHRFGRASRAEIAQLAARRSHNPKVVSSILTFRMLHVDAIDVGRAQLPVDTRASSTAAHSNSARAMRRAHYAESRMLTVCSPRLWSTMPHIMAATLAMVTLDPRDVTRATSWLQRMFPAPPGNSQT